MPENTHATRRGLTLEDLARISVPHEPHISPDGRTVVFTLARMDRAADTYHSNLWIAPADAAREARQLTVGDHKDHAPEFSPDGSRIAFVSNRGGASNVWLIATDGGEAQRLTDVKGEVDEIAWAPNGRALAFTFRPAPHSPATARCRHPVSRSPSHRRPRSRRRRRASVTSRGCTSRKTARVSSRRRDTTCG